MRSFGAVRRDRRCRQRWLRGFSLLELVVAVAIVAALAALAVPAYRGYARTARDAALAAQMDSIALFQEDLRLRTGSYASGRYDAARGDRSLTAALGWAPSVDNGNVYVVAADDARWAVSATDAGGHTLCRVYPARTPCAAP